MRYSVGVRPVCALKARLNGPIDWKPASSAMVRTGTPAWPGSASAAVAERWPDLHIRWAVSAPGHDALDLPALHGRGITTDRVLIFSGLWGVLRPADRIPHYRCSAGAKLPAVGSGSAAWRSALRAPLAAYVGDQLVVDLRSGAYGSLWAAGANAVSVRVLHERESGGVVRRSVVSHFNKATKGRLVRALLESGQRPRKPDELADLVRALGYTVEPGPESTRPGTPAALDIVVREL